jgi:acetylornithine deacetylase/succinyl-diaminopimelate desuccinylase-like protein
MASGLDGYLADREDAHLAELVEYLRIPSISALPEHRGDVDRAAEWTAEALRRAGVPEVQVLPSAGMPVVVGRWRVGDDKPTALIYGHYDVQPVDPLDLWESPPFEPAIRDGRLYARGSADMKGNILTAAHAVEAFARTQGQPPINVSFIVEGEEEVGSPNLPAFVRAHRELLACDVVVSADGGMFDADTPSVTVGLKGIASCQVDLTTGETDLHSGQFGAAVPNAARAIAELIAGFYAPDGRVAVAGFYDRVRDLTEEDRVEIAAPPFDEADLRQQAGVRELVGEAGYTTQERRWARPTLDVNGVWSGFQGAGTKTVTPCLAHAKVTCRLVPDQEPGEILDLIERHLAAHRPPGASVTLQRFAGAARPFYLRRDHPTLIAAKDVLREIYGKEPLVTRSGGTVPATALFQAELGADTVTFGWMLPDCRAHAPNEWYRLADFRRGTRAYVRLLAALADDGAGPKG